jgi:hypothetical protein
MSEAWCSRNLDPAGPTWQTICTTRAADGEDGKDDGNITAIIEKQGTMEAGTPPTKEEGRPQR